MTTTTSYAIGSLPSLTLALCGQLGHTYRSIYDSDYDYTSVHAEVPSSDLIWYLTTSSRGICVEVCTDDCSTHVWKDGVAADDVLDVLRGMISSAV